MTGKPLCVQRWQKLTTDNTAGPIWKWTFGSACSNHGFYPKPAFGAGADISDWMIILRRTNQVECLYSDPQTDTPRAFGQWPFLAVSHAETRPQTCSQGPCVRDQGLGPIGPERQWPRYRSWGSPCRDQGSGARAPRSGPDARSSCLRRPISRSDKRGPSREANKPPKRHQPQSRAGNDPKRLLKCVTVNVRNRIGKWTFEPVRQNDGS